MLIAALVLMTVPALALAGAWAYPRWRGRGFVAGAPAMVSSERLPKLSVLLPVHNGAHHIEVRLANLLDTDYPANRIELLMGCDGCTDATAVLARRWAERDARIHIIEHVRMGKAATLNALAAHATGEWLAFTDVSARFERTTLSQLIGTAMTNAHIGLVSGRWAGPSETSDNMEDFERIEARNALVLEPMRAADACDAGVLFVPWGPCYAQRREDFHPVPSDLLVDDAWVGLTHYARGGRAALAWHAVFHWRFARQESGQLLRRRRIAAGNLQLLLRLGHLLLRPHRGGLALWGQHGLRWLLPVWLLIGVQGYLLLAISATAAAVAFALVLFGGLLLVPGLPYRLRQVWAQLLGWSDVLRGRVRGPWSPTVR